MDGVSQFALGPERQPKKTMMALPAVVLSEHEKELVNNESLFSQLALESVDAMDGEAWTDGAPGRTISSVKSEPIRSTTPRLPSSG